MKADYGILKVSNVKSENGAVILKYHWPGVYRVKPDVRMEPYMTAGDPVGFIKAINPPREFVITVP